MTREELRKKRQEIARKNGYTEKYSTNPEELQGKIDKVKGTVNSTLNNSVPQLSTWQKVQNKISTIQNSTAAKFVGKELEIGNNVRKMITNPTQHIIDETKETWKKGINYVKDNKNAFSGWVDKGALSDGYQAGDITKSLVGTTADVGKQVIKGGVAQPRRSIGRFNEYSTGWI